MVSNSITEMQVSKLAKECAIEGKQEKSRRFETKELFGLLNGIK